MLKKLLCGAALAAGGLSAHAEVKVFNFSYQNLTFENAPVNDSFDGQFSVEDKDGDGVYGVSELLAFEFYRQSYLPCSGGGDGVDVECSIRAFSYQPGRGLDFSMEKTSRFGHGLDGSNVISGNYYIFNHRPASGGSHVSGMYFWTKDTTLSITAVPEPQAWMMLGAGLLALAATARRRAGSPARFAA